MELVVLIVWLASSCLGVYIWVKRHQRKLLRAVRMEPVSTAVLILGGPCTLVLSIAISSIATPETPERQNYLNEIIKEEIDSYIDNDWLEKEFQALEAQVAITNR